MCALYSLCLISRLTHFPFSWFCMSLPSGYFVSRDPKSKLVVKCFIWHNSSAQQIQRVPLLNCYYPFSINLMFWLVRISFQKIRALVIRVLTAVFVMARENHIPKVPIILIYHWVWSCTLFWYKRVYLDSCVVAYAQLLLYVLSVAIQICSFSIDVPVSLLSSSFPRNLNVVTWKQQES